MSALRDVVRRTGINPDQFLHKIADSEGVGGPEIPLDQVQVERHLRSGLQRHLSARQRRAGSAERSVVRSAAYSADACRSSGAGFDRTSGFGARIDPFTGRYAFHPGIDFAGPWGAPVHATAPGTVVFAGNRGGYGNMVEIDHGFGIHTRYGHLSAITVRGRRAGRAKARRSGGWVPPAAAPGRMSITKSGMTMWCAIRAIS